MTEDGKVFITFERRVPGTDKYEVVDENYCDVWPSIGEEVSVRKFNESVYIVRKVWIRYSESGSATVIVRMELLNQWTGEVIP